MALEETLGIELFDKRRTGYVLTEAGSRLLVPAEMVRQSVDAFQGAVESLSREISGTVRFTTNEVLGTYVLPSLIARSGQVIVLSSLSGIAQPLLCVKATTPSTPGKSRAKSAAL